MFILLALVALFLIILPFNNKAARKYMNGLLDHVGWIAGITMIAGVALNLAGFEDTALYEEMVNFMAALIMLCPAFFVRSVIIKKRTQGKEVNRETEIPATPAGRIAIVEKFNREFSLNLTEEEIQRVVDSSFQSDEWADEIGDMNKKYNSQSEWYNGKTAWLRAYLRVFNVQNVSSDFEYQKTLCIENFDQIFSEVDCLDYESVAECIKSVNERFLTNFDDLTFMIAYRFLEENGRMHRLPSSQVLMVDSELESLKNKYGKTTR